MKFVTVAFAFSAGSGLVGGFAGLPPWLVQLIVQFPLVALFLWRESRERKDRKAAEVAKEHIEKDYRGYLTSAPDKLIAFVTKLQVSMANLEKKVDELLKLKAGE